MANELLRFSTAGSVDDGKSTLIGRLLYDSKSIFEDQLAAITESTQRRGREGVDLALLTDGLAAEREQGITIDVAYRYFATPTRKFIIADTPGHEQYTRNMVTGASTADLALILVDAKKGIQPQSRRHVYISNLLGIKHILVCVNKMDLVEFSEARFNEIEKEFRAYVKDMAIPDLRFIPIAAKHGDNVVMRSERLPWYSGPTVMAILDGLEIMNDTNPAHFRFPVQYVSRPNAQYRGYCGTVVNGTVAPGQEILILPAGRTTRIARVVALDGDLPEACAGQSVSLTLAEDIDVSRGDLFVSPADAPNVAKQLTAKICWMTSEALSLNRKYILKHTTRLTKAMVTAIDHRVDVDTLAHEPVQELKLNDIAQIQIKTPVPLFADAYVKNRVTGSFILIDEATHNTVAAGMIV